MPGSGDRDGIYCMYFDGGKGVWSSPTKLPNRSTTHSPAMALFGDNVLMAWSGYHDHEPIFYALLRPGTTDWDVQAALGPNSTTDRGPALAVRGGLIYLFFRVPATSRINWITSQDFVHFSAPPRACR